MKIISIKCNLPGTNDQMEVLNGSIPPGNILVIKLNNGIEIEIHGGEDSLESLTISNSNVIIGNGYESFDFSVNPTPGNPESGRLLCDGWKLRNVLNKAINF